MFQTYDIRRTYEFNYDRGPVFPQPAPVVPDTPPKAFLGLPVRSRLGIAAGLLLNGKWILGYAERGFDILTYKTVRSKHRPCYDPPNWAFVDASPSPEDPVTVVENLPDDPRKISSAVCFGMPSMAPSVWRADIAETRRRLEPGQILIVSVVASPDESSTPQSVAADYRQCAEWAVEAGAQVVEANFSCPNVCSAEGSIYTDPVYSRIVARALREGIGRTPLLIKMGYLPDAPSLTAFLQALEGSAQGVTLVNGITRPVLHPDGRPAFGDAYRSAGVLGRTLHQPSVDQVRLAAGIIRDRQLPLSLAAVGGVSGVADIADFFDAGADAVLMGSSPMYLPDLAIEAKSKHPEW